MNRATYHNCITALLSLSISLLLTSDSSISMFGTEWKQKEK